MIKEFEVRDGEGGDVRFKVGEQYVVIFEASYGDGYMYDLYDSKEDYENDVESLDGGQCTGTLSDAIEMALS